ncbi:MAG: hypothetical protein ACTSRK_08440 [Promethearchaeota archaeon]
MDDSKPYDMNDLKPFYIGRPDLEDDGSPLPQDFEDLIEEYNIFFPRPHQPKDPYGNVIYIQDSKIIGARLNFFFNIPNHRKIPKEFFTEFFRFLGDQSPKKSISQIISLKPSLDTLFLSYGGNIITEWQN